MGPLLCLGAQIVLSGHKAALEMAVMGSKLGVVPGLKVCVWVCLGVRCVSVSIHS